ncbi:CRISPR-associated helicase Cas3' [Synechococcus sp. PCC 6312]|uniref:CRISPR-associated helicase Cas3' n=1 Tax=Synechococcus sp. (strain ATCC 27167 / PCC 6312) TaxID=195253 RepID=UPI00029F1779|nr:CRISPR-associated helicase Cas3' [Synechococcus sp. PCC 6312]AFY60377.1 CRISPR-associated helicase, Cas3 family [Synechococcus sp. PCC 6312]
MKRLLAKSYDHKKYNEPPPYSLLTQHSRDVASACKSLAQISGSIALRNAEIESELVDFERILRATGWLEDLGKASSHFLEMLTNNDGLQLIRHETISGLLACLEPQFQSWLEPLGKYRIVAIWGAMGHHRKFDERTEPNQVQRLILHISQSDNLDFNAILEEMSLDLGLGNPPQFERNLVIGYDLDDECDIPALESLNDLMDQFEKYEKKEFANEQSRRFVALVKGYGIAADVAASAVAKKEGEDNQPYSLSDFVNNDLSIKLSPKDLTQLIHSWAWRNSQFKDKPDLSQYPPGFTLRDFQENVAASKSYLTLAVAGCGSGKSLAAYLWARDWCEKLTDRNFRLFFCLPTTGTTTEHFKDYALESGIPESLIALAHSRSSIDLQTMAQTSPQEDAESSDTAKAAQETLRAEQDKIESLALWSTPLTVTTADTVLGLMVNARRSIYSLPAIMQSAIVFDEIHAFDDQMFGHLLVFLKNFPKLPVLLMTASLSEERLRAIEGIRPDLNRVPGLEEFEILPRYDLPYTVEQVNEEIVWREVQKCLENKGKVLWVRNRVDWANQIYQKAQDDFPDIAVNIYHSRLRYKDRSERHRRVIDTFKEEGKAALLVSTQVAEMSLDLSADLLVTDIAPVPALIQRMGRLNRRATLDNPGNPKSALICPLPNIKGDAYKPYEKSDIDTSLIWIQKLLDLNKSLCQRDLADKFLEVSDPKEYDYEKAEKRACFFSGVWRTRPGITRGEGYTISIVLEEDFKKCNDFKYGQPSPNWIRKHEVAIPMRPEVLKWERIAGVRIAPKEFVAYDYNETTKEGTGASWK